MKRKLFFIILILCSLSSVHGQCPNPVLYDLTLTNTSASPYWEHCIDNASDPDSFNLDLISPADIENYTVDFGDGKTTSGVLLPANNAITHKYGLGKFTITLSETRNGCTKVILGILVNDRKPGAAAQPPTLGSSGCVPKSLTFRNITSNASSFTKFEWNWGDGTKDVLPSSNVGQSVSHTYLKGKAGCNMKVKITAFGLCDTSFAEYGPYDFWDVDTAAVGASDTLLCGGDTVTFRDISKYNCNLSQPRKIRWDLTQLGGGTTTWLSATAANRTKKYFVTGAPGTVYTVFFSDSNYCGVANSAVKVRMIATPKAIVKSDKDSICAGLSTTFRNTSTGTANEYVWDFGDGSPLVTVSNRASQPHQYNNPGTYLVKLKALVRNGGLCADSQTIKQVVLAPPTTDFTIVQSGTCGTSAVTFTDNSSPDAFIWNWTISNGTVKTTKGPHFQTFDPGSYYVTLKTATKLGCESSRLKTFEVYPSVKVDMRSDTVCEDYPTAFFDNSVLDYGAASCGSGYIVRQQWDNLSGTTVSALTSSPDFPANPTSSSYLTDLLESPQNVSSRFGARILGFICPPETGNYTFWISSDDASELYLSTNADSSNKKRIAYASPFTAYREWNKYLEQKSVPVFLNAGQRYYIEVLHKENSGSDHVSVGWQLPSGILERPIPATRLSPYQKGNMIKSWLWDFGDGTTTSTVQNPTHQYKKGGTYTVKLTVATSQCSTTRSFNIVVRPKPVADFTLSKDAGCTPFTPVFTDQSVNAAIYKWNFGDGVQGTGPSPAHTFNNNGSADQSYTVSLITFSAQGCSDTTQKSVTVYPAVMPDYYYNPSGPQCSPAPVTFFNTTTTPVPVSYKWYIRKDSIITNDPTIQYLLSNKTGIVRQDTVNLVATTSQGCRRENKKVLFIFPESNIKIASPPAEGCHPFTTTFSTTGTTSFYNWEFGDGGSSISPSPTHTFINQSGKDSTYRVRLVATNAFLCSDTSYINVLVHPKPMTTNFAVSPSSITIPDTTVNITNFTSGSWDYLWNFGDGTTSTDRDPLKHYYYTPGSYTISLVASGAGCADTARRTITVLPGKPMAKIYGYGRGCNPLKTEFSIESKFSDTLTIDYGDGSKQKLVKPFPSKVTHTYTSENFFIVKLTAKGPGGTVTVTNDSIIQVLPAPTAGFTLSKTAVEVSEAFFLSNTSANATEYLWNFGDGTTSTGKDPLTHAYDDYNSYTIYLIARGAGCADTARKNITVLPAAPTITISGYGRGCSPFKVDFKIESSSVDTLTINFGDGNSKRLVRPLPAFLSHSYATPGFYLAKATAKGPRGTVTTNNDSILVVYETPVASFSVKPKSVDLKEPSFFSNSSENAVSYYWDFGDSETSTDKNPLHTYKSPGTYNVMLVASNSGCNDTLRVAAAAEVKELSLLAIPDAFTPSLSGSNGGNINNNGLNDIFYPLTENMVEFNMLIFDRWGELIFESKDPRIGWDGYKDGKLCKEEVYVYRIKGKDVAGKSVEKVGDVMLIHKQ